jgi:hypothetical protein
MSYLKRLLEVVDIVNRNVTKLEDKLRYHRNNKKEVLAIFDAIATKNKKQRFKKDSDLVEFLKISDPTFRKYADELIELLNQMIAHFDYEKGQMTAISKANAECFRETMAMEFLTFRDSLYATFEMSTKILKKAKFFGFPLYACKAIKVQIQYFSLVQPSNADVKRLRKEYADYERYWIYENEIIFAAYEINRLGNKKKALDPQLAILTQNLIEKFGKLEETVNSIQFNSGFHHITIKYYQAIADHEKVLEHIELAKAYLKSLKFATNKALISHLYNEAATCVILKRYEQGENAIKQAVSLFNDSGDTRWFNTLMISTYLCLHTKKYKAGFENYKNAVEHERFLTLLTANQDIWHLIGAHFKLLELSKRLKLSFVDEAWFKNFDEQRFATNEFSFNDDKKGLNITAQITQILFLKFRVSKSAFEARAEPMRKYIERHIEEDDQIRSKITLETLTEIAKNFELHSEKLPDLLADLREKLSHHPIQLYAHYHELEMMPFDDLVEILVTNDEQDFEENAVQ